MSKDDAATRRGVAKGMALGMVTTLTGLSAAFVLSPAALVPLSDSIQARARLLAQSALCFVGCLLLAIARLASHRFFTPADIHGSGLTSGTSEAKLLQAMLQNTLEQAVLALGVHCAGAIVVPRARLGVLPVGAVQFVLGRALFFQGYRKGAPKRAMGFALTFYPTVLLFLLSARYAIMAGAD